MSRALAAGAAVLLGVALGGLAGTVLRCLVDARELGPPVPVLPAIRDGGIVRRDRP